MTSTRAVFVEWWGHHPVGGSTKENKRRGFGKGALDNSDKFHYRAEPSMMW